MLGTSEVGRGGGGRSEKRLPTRGAVGVRESVGRAASQTIGAAPVLLLLPLLPIAPLAAPPVVDAAELSLNIASTSSDGVAGNWFCR